MSIFEHVEKPDSALFYRRNDPNDIRWGERVLSQPEDYDSTSVVLLGFPQDEGVSRNKGRVGAKSAPDAIRRCFYKLVALESLKLFDIGNTRIDEGATLEEMHSRHQETARQILDDGKTLIVLGGGNDTSYPDCYALWQSTGAPPLAFNIDAHFDVRADTPRNSGTPYRQLLKEAFITADKFFEIGYLPFANSPTYQRYLTENGVQTFPINVVHKIGLGILLRRLLESATAQSVFWGLDMDVVRASDAPGVSAVNPLGLTGEEFCLVASIAGAEPRTRLFEITEVNPLYDIDERTCRLAAAAIWHFLAAFADRL